MNRTLLGAICALALAVPASAQSGGFTEAQLADAAQSAAAEAAPHAAAIRSAAMRSERLRAVLAVAMDQAPTQLTREELRLVTTALGPPTVDRDILLGWLMRGGSVTAAGPDLTGIYNPFADGWLILRWNHVGGAPRLTDAALVTGASLRGGLDAPFATADVPFAQALVARRMVTMAALDGLSADYLFRHLAPFRSAQAQVALASARGQVGALAQWSREHPGSLTLLERAIDRRDDPALLSFPSYLSRDLGPAAVVATATGDELALLAPAFPTRGLFAQFPADGGQPVLFALDLDPVTGGLVQ